MQVLCADGVGGCRHSAAAHLALVKVGMVQGLDGGCCLLRGLKLHDATPLAAAAGTRLPQHVRIHNCTTPPQQFWGPRCPREPCKGSTDSVMVQASAWRLSTLAAGSMP